jgi:hypothetical protein
LTFSE